MLVDCDLPDGRQVCRIQYSFPAVRAASFNVVDRSAQVRPLPVACRFANTNPAACIDVVACELPAVVVDQFVNFVFGDVVLCQWWSCVS